MFVKKATASKTGRNRRETGEKGFRVKIMTGLPVTCFLVERCEYPRAEPTLSRKEGVPARRAGIWGVGGILVGAKGGSAGVFGDSRERSEHAGNKPPPRSPRRQHGTESICYECRQMNVI